MRQLLAIVLLLTLGGCNIGVDPHQDLWNDRAAMHAQGLDDVTLDPLDYYCPACCQGPGDPTC